VFRAIVSALAFAAVLVPAPPEASAQAADPSPSVYRIVPHGRPVHAGDHVAIRVVPEPPPGVRQAILVTTADGRTTSLVGPYRAPYVIEVGAAPVGITAALSGEGWRREVKTTLELAPGRLIGTGDCLGSDQAFLPEYGDIAGSAGDLSDMPQVLRAARPALPAGPGTSRFEGTVVVHALVCRSGLVLDAYVPPILADLRGAPIERDPEIVDAAIAAAKATVFGRGRAAAWHAIPVSFRR
jgi:hypothetical protein